MDVTDGNCGDRRRLVRLIAKESDATQRDRLRSVLLALQGRETLEIAGTVGRRRAFVQRWAGTSSFVVSMRPAAFEVYGELHDLGPRRSSDPDIHSRPRFPRSRPRFPDAGSKPGPVTQRSRDGGAQRGRIATCRNQPWRRP